jgi:TRAP-type C4-dicarboxylate transport system permease large subunit
MTVICLGVGLITPPVGMCLYIACDIMKLPLMRGAVALVPFLVATIVCMALILVFPQLILWPAGWIGT